ncbi:hypothetical protein [Armatimonas sp.]|uniref:hypothetical protein n=1 Tax=Armatimonas sp. TaxID=1872638 RepID=UPI00286B419B|nr:hypothetical protein [Armatimonas sp.]
MFKPKPKPLARLHFFFAREAPVGVIFREGPRKRIRLILWHTDTDTFELGHWFLGQLQFQDLSPDGKLLIYAAYKWHQKQENGYSDAWVAISKPPYLTALALWPMSWGRWGGAFLDNQTVELTGSLSVWSESHPNHPLPPWLTIKKQLISEQSPSSPSDWQPVVGGSEYLYAPYEKPLQGTQGRFILRCQARQSRSPLYTLYDSFEQTSQNLEAEQAEVDSQGRLILTRDGKLFVATLHDDGSLMTTELADFNDMVFEAIPPPEWAIKW